MTKLFANSGDPDQTPHSAASDLGLHCLTITILLVSRLQWVKSISAGGDGGVHVSISSVSALSFTFTPPPSPGLPFLLILWH